MRRRAFLRSTGVASVGLALSTGPASADVAATDVGVDSYDGTTIAATLHEPPATDWPGPRPAIVMTHGYGGTSADLAGRAERYATRGYVALAYDSRGFGDSGGTSGFDGPKEGADALSLVDQLGRGTFRALDGGDAVSVDVRTTADGPAVGMDGGSYGGGIQLNTAAATAEWLPDGVDAGSFDTFDLAAGSPIDAIVPRITWHDLVYAAAPDGGERFGGSRATVDERSESTGVIKATWDSIILAAGAPNGYRRGDRPDAEGPDPRIYRFVAEAVVTNEVPDEARRYFDERSRPKIAIDALDAPTLLIQGWQDNLLTPNQALWTFEGLRARDVPTALVLFPGGHDAELPTEPSTADAGSYVEDVALAWLDRYVKHGGDAGKGGLPVPPVSYYVYQDDRDPRLPGAKPWRTASEFPPGAATRTRLDLGPVRPTDRTPLANSAAPTTARGPTGSLVGAPRASPPAGTAVHFDFRATADAEVVGRPRLRLPVEPVGGPVHLFARLEHVQGGRSTVVDEQVTAFEAGTPGVQDVECIAVQRHLAAGERLRLAVSTSDNGYFSSRTAAGAVLHHAGDPASADEVASLSVPVISDDDEPFVPVPTAPTDGG